MNNLQAEEDPASSDLDSEVAIQIVEFVANAGNPYATIKLHEDRLQKILESAGDRPVCIYAIAGPSRRGKSFFLNFMLRSLEAKDEFRHKSGEDEDWMQWNNPNRSLEGFSWKSSTERETKGILMWGRPFIVKTPDGKEVAVFLVDTQGTYDSETTERETAAIIGISLLTSSCLIFNFFTQLQEDVFQSLETYLQYALLASNDNNTTSSGKHFQNLMFLIRDWNTPTEHNFGLEGGRDYLDKLLNAKPPRITRDSFKIRQLLKQSFENIDCCLLPEPGDGSRLQGFKGSLSELKESFSQKIEEVVEHLLDPEELKVKLSAGVKILASQMVPHFRKYVEVFNSDDLPSPQKIVDATAKIHNQALVDKIFSAYMEEFRQRKGESTTLSDASMHGIQAVLVPKFINVFDGTRKFGGTSIIEEYNKILGKRMEDYFKQAFATNSSYRRMTLDSAMSNCRMRYIQEINSQYYGKPEFYFVEEDVLERSYQCNADKSIIREAIGDEHEEEDVEQTIASFLSKLEEQKAKFAKDNQARRQKGEEWAESLREELEEKYVEAIHDMVSSSGGILAVNISELEACVAEVRSKCKAELDQHLLNAPDTLRNSVHPAVLKTLEDEAESMIASSKEKKATLAAELEGIGNVALGEMEKRYRTTKMGATEVASLVINTVKDAKSKVRRELVNSSIVEDFLADLQTKAFSKLGDIDNEADKEEMELLQEFMNDALEKFQEAVQEIQCTNTDFANQLAQERKDALQNFRSNSAHLKMENVQKVSQTLEQLMKAEEEELCSKMMKQQEDDKAVWNAGQVPSAESEYRKRMEGHIAEARAEMDFETYHAAEKSAVLQNLAAAIHGDSTTYASELSCIIDKVYKESLLPKFRLSLSEMSKNLSEVLDSGTKMYQKEVDTVVGSREFLHPSEMKQLDTSARKTAIERLQGSYTIKDVHLEELSNRFDRLFTNYFEENKMNVPQDPAIGIDLGTTCCCVAVYLPKVGVKIIPNQGGEYITPSYVSYGPTAIVEHTGKTAKDQSYINAESTIYDAKRLIGRKFNDPIVQKDIPFWPFTVLEDDEAPVIQVAKGTVKLPEQISAELLKSLKASARTYLGKNVSKAVITVPAYFSDAQRQATIDAGQLAGLEVLQILSEPVAAAVAYKMDNKIGHPEKVLIFDLGGGTLDVAVLQVDGREIKALAIDGDTHLGGEDFDNNLVKYCATTFQAKSGVDLLMSKQQLGDKEAALARGALRRLKLHCEDAKKILSSSNNTKITVPALKTVNGAPVDFAADISRQKFEELNQELFDKAINIVETCLSKAFIGKGAIDEVVLVGGSTRIPKIRSMLKDFFGGKALHTKIDADEAVAYGAALQAAVSNGGVALDSPNFVKVVDANPMSLGVEVYGGGFSIIIPRNTPLPAKIKDVYKTAHNNQTSVQIVVFQGEDEDNARKNLLLGEFILNGIPSDIAGKQNVDVTMEMNPQGILNVSAVSQTTGQEEKLTVMDVDRDKQRQRIIKAFDEAKSDGASSSNRSVDEGNEADQYWDSE